MNIKEVFFYIKKNLNNDIKLKSISDNFYSSKYHFSREFKRIKKFTIKEYISTLKIDKSIGLILKKRNSILHTQIKSGFLSSGSFSNSFKKYTGLSPKQYQERYLNSFRVIKIFEETKECSEIEHNSEKIKRNRGSCEVEIIFPKTHREYIVFVGLFLRPIPNHKPIVGKALLNKRTCKLKNIPDGKYYLLSCAIRKSNNPLDYFKLDKALRGMVEESINFPSIEEKKFEIVLREAEEDDPPIVFNVSQLLVDKIWKKIATQKKKKSNILL
ncbi:AraC family transcriptional regulator [Sebaldella sp. S0638]|uniref:helix-turn-helix domain-containing protein n=1 Tax=Sebaldella sp. S0638 TaxID=2957809 RepID=UPI00209DFB57|nr:AraC family transcriptional regulator [Sebaldella sp. S0638]MCP1226017.1 AraC family transcriptional regulator [Sebaldella sp. S0638]